MTGDLGWVLACPVAATLRRAIVPVQVAGQQILIVRDGAAVFALERACPHEGADLAFGRCAAGRLHCPRHLASFDLATGAVSPGWSVRALRRYEARIAGADVLVRGA